ncbi:hypothetical protein, partial [uncultured Enterobacter sp.]|uniref:hypothetical protein n=1 Tax=uncultured Enterobacter sp. TaxID=238202 RepID=UPI0025953ED1
PCCYEGSISGAGILIKELKRIANNDSFLEKKRERIVKKVGCGFIAILLHRFHNRSRSIASPSATGIIGQRMSKRCRDD